ncbi:MAG: hypothetical protein PHY93_04340 [Bacteriovorax sp.]|nr:hypothetical protein [Bacteriovorax sp.]
MKTVVPFVGIGTTSPAVKLQVAGEIRNAGDYSSSADSVFYSFNGASAGTVQAGIQAVGSGQNLRFSTANSERLRIDSSGNVGIGTTSPGYKLNIVADTSGANTNELLTLSNNAATIGTGASINLGILGYTMGKIEGLADASGQGSLRFYTYTTAPPVTEKMRITSAGNVGIGTVAPGQKLSVAGVIESTTGGIKFPDGTTQTAAVRSAHIPTVQKFTSGSGTYTTPTGIVPLYIRVRMVGGGGGGGGGGIDGTTTSAGSNGGASTFGSSLLTANGGYGGVTGIAGGGTASLGTGPIGLAVTGASGTGWMANNSIGMFLTGGVGGASQFGANGAGNPNSSGTSAGANSGSGGGGGGTNGTTSYAYALSGGGAGGYIDAIITNPALTYGYTVGAGGAGGTAGTSGFVGGAGGSGMIIIEEFYQ